MKDVSIFYKKTIVLEIINLEEGKINPMNYPVLYEYIDKNEGLLKHTKSKSSNYKLPNKKLYLQTEISEDKKEKKLFVNIKNVNKKRMNDIIQTIKNNKEMKEEIYSFKMEEEKFKIFKLIPKKKEIQLFNMSEGEIVQYIKLMNKIKNIENYINKYFKSKNGNITKFNAEEE